jgi:hypothetical protein
MVATRNAWAESMTWEKTTGQVRFSIWRNFAAIGSDRATSVRRSPGVDFSTANVSPKQPQLQRQPRKRSGRV